MIYKTILFDLDGTLIDPVRGITHSVQFALDQLGSPALTPIQLRQFIGPPLLSSFQRWCGMDRNAATKAIEYYRQYYDEKGIYENQLYPEVKKMLTTLHSQEKRIILATSKPTIYAHRILQLFEIEGFFEKVAGSNLDLTRTSKFEVISFALSDLTPSERKSAVMVGDTHFDVEGARQAGIKSIAVLYGYGSPYDLKLAMPTIIAPTVGDLYHILTQA